MDISLTQIPTWRMRVFLYSAIVTTLKARACTPKCLPAIGRSSGRCGTQACLRAEALRLPARSRSGEGRARKRGNPVKKGEIASFHAQ